MPFFSSASKEHLSTCDEQLQIVFNEVIAHYDCRIVEGHRSKARQKKLVAEGKSKTMNSKHLSMPSKAVDAEPWPLDYEKLDAGDRDTWHQFYHFVGYVLATATMLGIKLRCGADWNRNMNIKDETFRDLFHFELVED